MKGHMRTGARALPFRARVLANCCIHQNIGRRPQHAQFLPTGNGPPAAAFGQRAGANMQALRVVELALAIDREFELCCYCPGDRVRSYMHHYNIWPVLYPKS